MKVNFLLLINHNLYLIFKVLIQNFAVRLDTDKQFKSI